MEEKRLWVFKSFEETRSFGGNEGYADEPELHYVYDSTVINHNRVSEGDFVAIVNKKNITGIAIIEQIIVQPNSEKKQYSCPKCGTKRIATRKNALLKYKCKNQHEFENPVASIVFVNQYKAIYSSSYQRIIESIPANVIKDYYVSYNAYYSIQAASLGLLNAYFPQLIFSSIPILGETVYPSYIPSISDSRDYRHFKSVIRPAQAKFRQQLVDVYGLSCMISGCLIPEIIDASHICPYRGLSDNHPGNGLLLRKDLHALFDADLLGIEPHSLIVHISASLSDTAYELFEGQILKGKSGILNISLSALMLKWTAFKERDLNGQGLHSADNAALSLTPVSYTI